MHFSRRTVRETNTIGKPLPMSWPAARIFRAISFEVLVDGVHHGQQITIMRNQNQTNVVNPDFAKTLRKCPPFCIQPSELAPGVKTIAELEVLHFLQQIKERNHECVFTACSRLSQQDMRKN